MVKCLCLASDTIRKITDCDVPKLSKPQVVSEVTNGTLQCQTSSPELRPPACRPTAISQHVHFSCCTPKKVIRSQGEEVGELIFEIPSIHSE